MSTDKFSSSLNSLLSEGRLKYVISLLRSKCVDAASEHPDLRPFIHSLDRIEETYDLMRGFLLQGQVDRGRDKIYEDLKRQLREIARNYLFIINENRSDPFFVNYRICRQWETSVDDILRRVSTLEGKEKEESVERLFNKVWSLPPWDKESFRRLGEVLADPDGDYVVKAQIISALLLGLLKFNDPQKLLLLISAYNSDSDERVSARALLAIVLVLARWGNSALAADGMQAALESVGDSILTFTRLRDIVMTIIRTHDTDRVNREIKDAFDSTMREISPEMLKKLQDEGLAVDATETGMNPEWEKLIKNKELEEKMQSINDMQLQGMDVMMQTFARLKSFAFFRPVANWFLPFSPNHSGVSPLFDKFNEEAFMAMANTTEMCNGDRFSFVFGILQMPQDKRNMLAANVSGALDMLKEQFKDSAFSKRRSAFASEALVFARDLYRFAKLYPQKGSFFDPFSNPLDFTALPVLGEVLRDSEIMLRSADFYFEYGYYPEALSLYEKCVSQGVANRQIFEKMGYCCQKQSDFVSALQNYEKADLFSTDEDRSSAWLVKKLAFCNKALGNYSRAAEYYRRVLDMNPDDLNVEFHLGSLLLRSGDMRHGREIISKVRYLNPENETCERIYLRLKGHDAFLEGRLSEAAELYDKARGSQDNAQYHRDLVSELSSLSSLTPEQITTLRILLDN